MTAPPQPPERPALPDADDRHRIATDLATTLFVEAGAGSGKTTALVGRILALVTSGSVELREVAAITFTEKAAAELRDRLRQGLEQTSEQARLGGRTTEADRCDLAIDQLDGAAIGTLHSFAQRILAENPIEAGLPPRVEILDEVSSEVAFDHRWRSFQDQLLTDPALERTLLLLFGTGVRPEALRVLAQEFDRNWDLVEERVPALPVEPPTISARLAPALAAIDDACGRMAECTDPADRLHERLVLVTEWVASVRSITDELDLLDELGPESTTKPSFKVGNLGNKGKWSCDMPELRAQVRAAGDGLELAIAEVTNACAQRVGTALRQFTLDAARARQAEGRLAFHDLLVLARSLVRHPAHGVAVRRRLHQRYRCLLLDEFQDTDPIQLELAVRIAAADPEVPASGTAGWDEVPVAPGHLFVVGDPKQSIYRFRRADISVFLEARRHFGHGGGLVELSTNFRTGAPVIDWVNRTFGALMAEPAALELPVPSQPDYVALHAVRPEPPVGPAVSVLGRDPLPAKTGAPQLRQAEADEVAATIERIVAEGWSVGQGDDGWRPANLGDITVLVPARTSMPFLEDALERSGIAYRAESSSLVYVSRAIRDLLLVARAVDDPTDHLAIVAALRTPLFACGDDDLFRFKVEQGGRWNYLAPQPPSVAPGPVSSGLDELRALHRDRHWCTPAELLDRIARDRRLFELGFAEGRTRDVWRRLRFVIDQAREWGEATHGGLREYLQWVARQTNEGARVAEAVLPETDDDAVRIMTVHAAKGLEFPVTILSGMSTVPQSRRSPAQVAFPPGGRVAYQFGAKVTTEEFEAWKPIDEQMGFDERVRLLYVASTRARDHLVVSLHRRVRASTPEATKRTNAELLLDGMGDLLGELPDAVDPSTEAPPTVAAPAPEPPLPFATWEAQRAGALAGAARPTTVAATALTVEGAPDVADAEAGPGPGPEPEPGEAGLRKRPPDQDLPPWLKGRYGTAVGRAVHATLQTIDLATGHGLADAVAAQCDAEAIADRQGDVEALVRAALGSPSVVEAAGAAHWREVYACTPTPDGRLLEGYIDLLYRSADGIVVVDYKTAATDHPDELARRTAGYRLQGASYALTVARTTGEPVSRVTFVYLTPGGAVEVHLDDVDVAVAEVLALVERGEERVLA